MQEKSLVESELQMVLSEEKAFEKMLKEHPDQRALIEPFYLKTKKSTTALLGKISAFGKISALGKRAPAK